VGQLSWPSKAGVERLAVLARAFARVAAARFEKVVAAIREEHDPILGTETDAVKQTFGSEMVQAFPTIGRVRMGALQVALGDHAERSDVAQDAAVSAVERIHAAGIPHELPIRAARHGEVAYKDIPSVLSVVSVARRTPAAAVPIP
jgi:hypothetical protein